MSTRNGTPRKELKSTEWTQLQSALRPFMKQHPEARVDAYRRNVHSLRIRIIDPFFKNMDRVDRDEYIWKYLDQLPKQLHQEITMLLVLTPDEQDDSFMNYDYEHPLPSSLV